MTSFWCYSRTRTFERRNGARLWWSKRTNWNQILPQTIVAMITSNIARAGHPSRVLVRVVRQRANETGLLMDSVIMTDNLATVLYWEIDRVIGTFPLVAELDNALRTTLAL